MNCFLQKFLKIHNQMSLDKLLTKMLSNNKDILVPLFDNPLYIGLWIIIWYNLKKYSNIVPFAQRLDNVSTKLLRNNKNILTPICPNDTIIFINVTNCHCFCFIIITIAFVIAPITITINYYSLLLTFNFY